MGGVSTNVLSNYIKCAVQVDLPIKIISKLRKWFWFSNWTLFFLTDALVVHLRWKEKRKADNRTSVRAVWRARAVRKSAPSQRAREERKTRKTMVRIFSYTGIRFYETLLVEVHRNRKLCCRVSLSQARRRARTLLYTWRTWSHTASRWPEAWSSSPHARYKSASECVYTKKHLCI